MAKVKEKKKIGNMSPLRFWVVVWGMGLAGQLCWNMENQWFNTFVYSKIGKNPSIITTQIRPVWNKQVWL